MNELEIINISIIAILLIAIIILIFRKGSEEGRLEKNVKIKKLQVSIKILDEKLNSNGEPTLSELVNSGQIIPQGGPSGPSSESNEESRTIIEGFNKKKKE